MSATSDGSLEFFNQAWQQYTGLAGNGRAWTDSVHPDDVTHLLDYWNSAEPQGIEARLRGQDGEYALFQIRRRAVVDPSGLIIRWYGTASGTSSHRAEPGAEINTIPTLAWSTTPEGLADFLNRRWLDYTGLSLDQALGYGWTGPVHPDDVSGIISYWQSLITSGGLGEYEARLRRFDGVYRWFLFRAEASRDPSGRILKWYGTNTDIEDRKQAEEALRARERNLRAIINTIPTLSWSTRPDGYVEFLSERWLGFTGLTEEQALGFGWAVAIYPEDAQRLLEYWQSALDSGTEVDVEARLRRFDGVYRWFLFRASPLRDESGKIVKWYGTNIDIDDRIKIVETLRNTEARLSRAAQIATVGEMSASIAHEINQPLAAVVASGHACRRFLLAEPPNVGGAREAAESIVRDGKDAAEVIRRVRALFKRAAVEKTMLNVNDVIREVLRLLAGEIAKRRVSVEADLAKDLPPVPGDPVQLQQLTSNLLLNGMEAMDSVNDRPRKLSVRSLSKNSGTVLVEVTDSGVGIENPEKAFEAFVTTKENGMGMGLTICRSIIEAHQGRLWVTAAPGPGATLCFTLPTKAELA